MRLPIGGPPTVYFGADRGDTMGGADDAVLLEECPEITHCHLALLKGALRTVRAQS